MVMIQNLIAQKYKLGKLFVKLWRSLFNNFCYSKVYGVVKTIIQKVYNL